MSVFDFNGTFWDAVGQALDGEIAEEWQSGAISLSMDGSILAISAAGTESETGSVRVHSTWTQKGQSLVGERVGDQFRSQVVEVSMKNTMMYLSSKSASTPRSRGRLWTTAPDDSLTGCGSVHEEHADVSLFKERLNS